MYRLIPLTKKSGIAGHSDNGAWVFDIQFPNLGQKSFIFGLPIV